MWAYDASSDDYVAWASLGSSDGSGGVDCAVGSLCSAVVDAGDVAAGSISAAVDYWCSGAYGSVGAYDWAEGSATDAD